MVDFALQVALDPLAQVAQRTLTVIEAPTTDESARRGAQKLLRSLQLSRLALEMVAKFPGGIEELERERAERYGA